LITVLYSVKVSKWFRWENIQKKL